MQFLSLGNETGYMLRDSFERHAQVVDTKAFKGQRLRIDDMTGKRGDGETASLQARFVIALQQADWHRNCITFTCWQRADVHVQDDAIGGEFWLVSKADGPSPVHEGAAVHHMWCIQSGRVFGQLHNQLYKRPSPIVLHTYSNLFVEATSAKQCPSLHHVCHGKPLLDSAITMDD
ncbi:hypothetical protein WK54_03460 [Burkholderia ubonensis]|nr:hypothetical protein WK54_03460 [Burkholderia ubonensis]